jgi:hypothetical protein
MKGRVSLVVDLSVDVSTCFVPVKFKTVTTQLPRTTPIPRIGMSTTLFI